MRVGTPSARAGYFMDLARLLGEMENKSWPAIPVKFDVLTINLVLLLSLTKENLFPCPP